MGLDTYSSSDRMRFIHPISTLSFGSRSMPSDLALESSDTLTLYRALEASDAGHESTIGALQPALFFKEPRFLRQKDVLSYESALKDVVGSLLVSSDRSDGSSKLNAVIRNVSDPVLAELPSSALNTVPARNAFRSNLLPFVADLQEQGDLVSSMQRIKNQSRSCNSSLRSYFPSTERIVKSWPKTFFTV